MTEKAKRRILLDIFQSIFICYNSIKLKKEMILLYCKNWKFAQRSDTRTKAIHLILSMAMTKQISIHIDSRIDISINPSFLPSRRMARIVHWEADLHTLSSQLWWDSAFYLQTRIYSWLAQFIKQVLWGILLHPHIRITEMLVLTQLGGNDDITKSPYK